MVSELAVHDAALHALQSNDAASYAVIIGTVSAKRLVAVHFCPCDKATVADNVPEAARLLPPGLHCVGIAVRKGCSPISVDTLESIRAETPACTVVVAFDAARVHSAAAIGGPALAVTGGAGPLRRVTVQWPMPSDNYTPDKWLRSCVLVVGEEHFSLDAARAAVCSPGDTVFALSPRRRSDVDAVSHVFVTDDTLAAVVAGWLPDVARRMEHGAGRYVSAAPFWPLCRDAGDSDEEVRDAVAETLGIHVGSAKAVMAASPAVVDPQEKPKRKKAEMDVTPELKAKAYRWAATALIAVVLSVAAVLAAQMW